MAKPSKSGEDQSNLPVSYPNTAPPMPPDVSGWLLNATGKLEATLTGLQGQLGRIENKLTEVENEVRGHGKWMHTLKAFSAVVLLILGWIFVNGVWPWLKSKLNIP